MRPRRIRISLAVEFSPAGRARTSVRKSTPDVTFRIKGNSAFLTGGQGPLVLALVTVGIDKLGEVVDIEGLRDETIGLVTGRFAEGAHQEHGRAAEPPV